MCIIMHIYVNDHTSKKLLVNNFVCSAYAAFLLVGRSSPNAVAKTVTFCERSWGLSYADKTRKVQVLLAGSTINTYLEKWEY